MSIKIVAPSWEEIQNSCLAIAERTRAESFTPEIIIGITRGGWIPARLLTDLLGTSMLTSLGISFYTDIATTKKKPKITQSLSSDLKGKIVLIADDVADTGESLRLGRDHILSLRPRQLKVATIFKKPWSIITPDYYTSETDAWIVFPWEQAESTRSLKKKLSAEGLGTAEIKQRLLDAGLNKAVIDAAMS